jgi:dephospho-CoA kinase
VIRRIKEGVKKIRRANTETVIVLDVPLLIEAGLQGLVDRLIIVKAAQQQQIARCLKDYGLTRKDILARIKAQMPIKEKIRFADFVIDNSGTLERTKKEVRKIWERIQPRTIQRKRT